MRSTDTPIPAQLAVVAWPDPVVDALGFLPHNPYSELVWTLMSGGGPRLGAWSPQPGWSNPCRVARCLGTCPRGSLAANPTLRTTRSRATTELACGTGLGDQIASLLIGLASGDAGAGR